MRSTGTGRHERHSAAAGRIRGPRRSTYNGPLDGRRLIKFTPRDDRLACTSSLPAATAAACCVHWRPCDGPCRSARALARDHPPRACARCDVRPVTDACVKDSLVFFHPPIWHAQNRNPLSSTSRHQSRPLEDSALTCHAFDVQFSVCGSIEIM